MTVSQIIKTAEHKADVKNTDFIDYQQKMEILNNAYRQVYQESINAGEQFFLKKVSLSNGQTMPSDFYTIQEVFDGSNTLYRNIIPKMNSSTLVGYDIVNNKFVLKGWTTATVVYNPKPIYLTFQGKSVPTKIPYNENIVSYYKNYFLENVNDVEEGVTINTFNIRNSDNDILGTFTLNYSTETAIIRDSFVYLGRVVDDADYFEVFDFEGNLVDSYSASTLVPSIDSVVYFHTTDNETWLYSIEGSPLLKMPNDSDIDIVYAFYSEYTNTLYFNVHDSDDDKNYAYIFNEEGLSKLDEIKDTEMLGLMHYDDSEWLYCNIKGIPQAITDQGVTNIKKEGIARNNLYGTDDYLVLKGNVYVHASPIPDTEVDYPNNVYYTYLSALIAYEFIKRLEGNADSINLQVEEERFFKTIHRDNSQYVVLKDINNFF